MERNKQSFNQIKEKGITLVALVVTIVILLILAGITINMTVGQNGLFRRAQNAVDTYKKSASTEQSQMDALAGILDGVNGNTFNKDKKVNVPSVKTGMTPIKFEEATASAKGQAVTTNIDDSAWYDYTAKHWANAQTQDGSMWVWIPRYAYKINSSNQTTDVVFLIGNSDKYYDADGNIQTAKRCTSVDETVDTTTGYTVHPAFTNESSIGYRNGGWDSELTGIWISKFEAGYAGSNGANNAPVKASSVNYSQSTVWAANIEVKGENPSATTDGTLSARNWLDGVYGSTITSIKYPTFQGTTYSMNYINHSDAYSISKAMNEGGNIYGLSNDSDSHLIKNSEWGAISYLSKSQYGLSSTDIAVNSKNMNNGGVSTTKANGNTLASVYAITGYNNNGNEWNSNIGSNLSASTTGNIYGIYDLSGGTWERSAAYVANGNGNLASYGSSFAKATTSTKYATVYASTEIGSDDNARGQSNYEANTKIYGDAVRETSTAGAGATSWYGDYSYFPEGGIPFFGRGGGFWGGGVTGLFFFFRDNGNSYGSVGFRAVLA